MPFISTANDILSFNCRSCRDPISISILSQVRCKLLELLLTKTFSKNEDNGVKMRINTTIDFMTYIQNSSYKGPGGGLNDHLLLIAVLIGGVIPILDQHMSQLHVQVLKIGSIGLSSLLPLMQWNTSHVIEPKQIIFLSMIGLISLMMTTYPIMENHGGKLMSACICVIANELNFIKCENNHDKDTTLDEYIIDFAIHTASVVLVICQNRNESKAILNMIQNGDYMTELKNTCEKINSGRKSMLSLES